MKLGKFFKSDLAEGVDKRAFGMVRIKSGFWLKRCISNIGIQRTNNGIWRVVLFREEFDQVLKGLFINFLVYISSLRLCIHSDIFTLLVCIFLHSNVFFFIISFSVFLALLHVFIDLQDCFSCSPLSVSGCQSPVAAPFPTPCQSLTLFSW